MNPHTIGPQDIPDWRKRMTAIAHYILELENSLDEAKARLRKQERYIEVLIEERDTFQNQNKLTG